jgi:signal peptidase II
MSDSLPQRLAQRWPHGIVLILVVAIDQMSKLWIVGNFRYQEIRPVIDGFFELTYLLNSGGVWGLGRDLPDAARVAVFLALPTIITCAAVWYSLSLPLHERLRQYSIALVVGGAIGNLIDRLRIAQVIDFLVFHWEEHYWPAFNLADSAICIGIAVLMVTTIFERDPDPEREDEATGSAGA